MRAGEVKYSIEAKCLGYSIVQYSIQYTVYRFEEDRRGRPGRYLQLNPEQPKHQCSPESISRPRAKEQ